MESFVKTENLCRICLVENNEENVKSVFDTIHFTTEPHQFSEMLMTFAKVEIISGDELPDQICSTCAQNTIKLYLFKIQCEESDKTLRNRLKDSLCIDKKVKDEQDILDKLKFAGIKEENTHTQDIKPLLISNKSLNDSKNRRRHSARHEVTKSTKRIPVDSIKTLYECDVCSKIFSTSTSFKFHKFKHTGEKAYECDICKMKFYASYELSRHKRKHTGEKPYECDVCKKRFIQSSTLGRHKRTHTGEKPYKCYYCKKRFIQASALLYHKRTQHTGEKPFKCDVCAKELVTSRALVVHKLAHTGEKPYECGVCKKRFFEAKSLNYHKSVHTDERPYECDVCEKKFKLSSALVRHKRTHK